MKLSRREISDLHSGADEYAKSSQYIFTSLHEVEFVSVHAIKAYEEV